jgi:hypothetical protein
MGQIFRIHEVDRDDDLGVVKKQISSSNGSFSFESPVVSERTTKLDPNCQRVRVNEIIRQIDDKVVASLAMKTIKAFADEVRAERIDGKLNATIFNLKYNSVPDENHLKIIAHALHSSSQNAMFLPTVKTSFLQELKPGTRKKNVFHLEFTKAKINSYLNMMKLIIGEGKRWGNGIEIVGTIPFIPFGFVEPIIDLYLSEGIRAFAIDANYKDIMGNLGDFTLMLSKIDKTVKLNDALIYACNAGIPHFEANESTSNDFLSVFAYVDVLGTTFKPRGGGGSDLAKVFSRDRYAYNLATYPEINRQFGRPMNYFSVRKYNRNEQLKESLKVQSLIGVEKMKNYLETKPAVNQKAIKRLETVAKSLT